MFLLAMFLQPEDPSLDPDTGRRMQGPEMELETVAWPRQPRGRQILVPAAITTKSLMIWRRIWSRSWGEIPSWPHLAAIPGLNVSGRLKRIIATYPAASNLDELAKIFKKAWKELGKDTKYLKVLTQSMPSRIAVVMATSPKVVYNAFLPFLTF